MIQPKAPPILARAALAKRLGEGMGEVLHEVAIKRSAAAFAADAGRITKSNPLGYVVANRS
jgi:hypothetical protein